MKAEREKAAHALCVTLGVDPLDDAMTTIEPAREEAAAAIRTEQKRAMERLLRHVFPGTPITERDLMTFDRLLDEP